MKEESSPSLLLSAILVHHYLRQNLCLNLNFHPPSITQGYEDKMAKDKNILEAIEKYTDHRTRELFHYEGAKRVEYGYSRLFCDVEKLEKNEPMEGSIGFGDFV